MMAKRIIAALCLVSFVFLAGCQKDTADSTPEKDAGTTAGFQIDTVTLDDEPITEEAFADSDLIVLNVWATWCSPCVSELPHLQEVSEQFKDKNVQIVGVLHDGVTASGQPDKEIIKSAQTLLTEAGVTYPVILPDDNIKTQFLDGMQYFPTTFFINAEGEIVHTEVGGNDSAGWEAIINGVLQEISE